MSEKSTHVDPSALGLLGLAMVTLVASSQKLGITTGVSLIIPWAIFLGALAQLMAGALDYKKGNVFGATAFCGYGFFWLAVSTTWMINLGALGPHLQAVADSRQLAFGFLGYLIFTLFMTVGSMETNKVLLIDFILIDFLFLGLTVSTFIPEGSTHELFHYMAAYAELGISLVSFYGMGANVLNNHFGYAFLPIGKPSGIFVK